MKRAGYFVVCLFMPACVPAAWGQTNGLNSTAASALSSALAATTTQPASDIGDIVKQGIRRSLAQVVVDMIQNVFQGLRVSFGLPAVPTDPTADPLAILESTIEDLILTAAGA